MFIEFNRKNVERAQVWSGWRMLWGMVDWGGLDISNEKAEMIGCPLAEALKWQG